MTSAFLLTDFASPPTLPPRDVPLHRGGRLVPFSAAEKPRERRRPRRRSRGARRAPLHHRGRPFFQNGSLDVGVGVAHRLRLRVSRRGGARVVGVVRPVLRLFPRFFLLRRGSLGRLRIERERQGDAHRLRLRPVRVAAEHIEVAAQVHLAADGVDAVRAASAAHGPRRAVRRFCRSTHGSSASPDAFEAPGVVVTRTPREGNTAQRPATLPRKTTLLARAHELLAGQRRDESPELFECVGAVFLAGGANVLRIRAPHGFVLQEPLDDRQLRARFGHLDARDCGLRGSSRFGVFRGGDRRAGARKRRRLRFFFAVSFFAVAGDGVRGSARSGGGALLGRPRGRRAFVPGGRRRSAFRASRRLGLTDGPLPLRPGHEVVRALGRDDRGFARERRPVGRHRVLRDSGGLAWSALAARAGTLRRRAVVQDWERRHRDRSAAPDRGRATSRVASLAVDDLGNAAPRVPLCFPMALHDSASHFSESHFAL